MNAKREDEALRGTGRTTALMLQSIADALQRPDEWVEFRDHHPTRGMRRYASMIRHRCERNYVHMDVEEGDGCVRLRSPISRLRSSKSVTA